MNNNIQELCHVTVLFALLCPLSPSLSVSPSHAATFAANLRVGREHPHVDLIKVVLGRRNQQQKMAPQKAEGCNAGQRQRELKHMCENWQSKRPKQIAKVGAAATAAAGAAGASAAMGALLNGHRRCIGQGKGGQGRRERGFTGWANGNL